jgi:PAS domain S-box-containing protein
MHPRNPGYVVRTATGGLMGAVAEHRSSSSVEVERVAALEALFDASYDAMLAFDPEGVVTLCNTAASRLFGRDTGDLARRQWSTLFPENQHHTLRVAFDNVGAGGRVYWHETEIARHDGSNVAVALSLAPVVDGSGSVIGMVAVARDTTEEHLAQEMLAEAEARLHEGEALAHIGRWLWDVGTGEVQWSAEFHRIHGVDPLDFDGTLAAHLAAIHRRDRKRVREALTGVAESGRAAEIDYRVVRPDGDVRRISARAEPTFDAAGSVVGVRGIGRDVTAD